MGELLWLLAILGTPFGVVLVAIGVILRLCESSWGKPAGGMGSRGLLLPGTLLCTPLIACLLG
jgi:hypothetical protein